MQPTQVAVVIVQRPSDGAVLIDQRTADNKLAPGKWEFPGGKVDQGESLTATACREIKEETNLTLAESSLKELGVCEQRGEYAVDVHFFHTMQFTGAAIPSGEVAALKWVLVEDIPALKDFLPNERGQTEWLLQVLS